MELKTLKLQTCQGNNILTAILVAFTVRAVVVVVAGNGCKFIEFQIIINNGSQAMKVYTLELSLLLRRIL